MTSTETTSKSPKYDLAGFSFILHYRKDSADREQNLRRILKFLRDNFIAEIVIINDEKNIDNPPTWIKEWADQLLICHNDDEFRKSYCYNEAASKAKGDIFCFWDVDVMVDPKFVWESYLRIDRGFQDHIYPFNGTFIDVQKLLFPWLENYHFDQMMGLWGDKDEDLHFASGESPGGCNMITREAFEKIGGYDQRFIGWGFEDTDFMQRSKKMNRVSRIMDDDAICWHFNHEAIRTENPHYMRNLLIYNENVNKL
jgi:predicted glycosyltransferase involved in capsule biosynthesis